MTAHLAEAQDALRAIRHGEVDAVVVPGEKGPRVFTLEGAERAYRVLIESMNEGALTLTRGKTILYANGAFARMVKRPLEQVIGTSLRTFFADEDHQSLKVLLRRAGKAGSQTQMVLLAGKGSRIPVLLSIPPLARILSRTSMAAETWFRGSRRSSKENVRAIN